ncbi:MAG: ABC transporter permease [Lachnospiraceae bacterium]|nr:ABC transporter permease [Lachnospiraceae bacterium]
MCRYIIRRLLTMILILVASAFLIFTLLYFTPADPADAQLGISATWAEKEALRETLGLNRPYAVQLGEFMYNTFIKFDFGKSWTYGTPVFGELMTRIPRTLTIGIGAMVINLAIGILMGIFAGVHAGKWQDSLVMCILMVFIACPNFWVALMLVLLFSAKLNLLPAYGIGGYEYYIMPIIASAVAGIAVNARFMRNSIVEVFRADYITTARAKGMKEKLVIYKEMLPNALMPTITNMGRILSGIIAGAPVIESVFSIPGVGNYLLTAINQRDYPTVRACVLFLALCVSLIMLAVDLAYAAIDPRIRAQFSKGGR